jgi:hypothetical protein
MISLRACPLVPLKSTFSQTGHDTMMSSSFVFILKASGFWGLRLRLSAGRYAKHEARNELPVAPGRLVFNPSAPVSIA